MSRASTITPFTEINQASGCESKISRRQSSGSIGPIRRRSRISFALAARVLLGIPVSMLNWSPVKCRRCERSNRKFTLPKGVDDCSGPNAQVAAFERRGTLAGQFGHELAAQIAVLGVQVLGAERVGQLEDLLSLMAESLRDAEAAVVLMSSHRVIPSSAPSKAWSTSRRGHIRRPMRRGYSGRKNLRCQSAHLWTRRGAVLESGERSLIGGPTSLRYDLCASC